MGNSIAGIAEYLERFAPDRAEALKTRFPDQAAIFDHRGTVLGDDISLPRQEAAWQMLESVGTVVETASADVRARLAAARLIDRIGSLVALASSAGLLAALQIDRWLSGALWLASIAFIGSALPLLVNWLRSVGNASSATDALVRLHDLVWQARALQARLKRSALGDDDIDQANDLARQLTGLLSELGYSSKARPV